jgi:hypothetical protein
MPQSPQNVAELFELAALLRRNAQDMPQSPHREQLHSAADEIEKHARATIADGRRKGVAGSGIFGSVNLTV